VSRIARRTSVRAATAALAVVLLPALTGCAIGSSAATGAQLASGNGANATAGDLLIRDITIVLGKTDATRATLIGTVVNTGTSDEALTTVSLIDPKGTTTITGAQAMGGTLPLPPTSSTRVGYNSDDHVDITGLTVDPRRFVTVELAFKNAGRVRMSVMAVPPTGIYEGIGSLSAS
jgi:hypothetical protein